MSLLFQDCSVYNNNDDDEDDDDDDGNDHKDF